MYSTFKHRRRIDFGIIKNACHQASVGSIFLTQIKTGCPQHKKSVLLYKQYIIPSLVKKKFFCHLVSVKSCVQLKQLRVTRRQICLQSSKWIIKWEFVGNNVASTLCCFNPRISYQYAYNLEYKYLTSPPSRIIFCKCLWMQKYSLRNK